MAPEIRLYRRDEVTFRTVQRTTPEGTEVLMIGSEGERAHQTFTNDTDAKAFREQLEALIAAKGFKLAWVHPDQSVGTGTLTQPRPESRP